MPSEVVRRVIHQFEAKGADKVAGDYNKITSEQTTQGKATLSLERNFAGLERRYVSTVRAQQDYERVQRQVNAAVAQNHALQSRANAVLDSARARYIALTGANDNYRASLGRSFSTIGTFARGFISGGLFTALTGVFDILSGRKFVEATIEQDKALAQLSASLKSTGEAAGLSKEELIAFAGEMQKTTTFGDEAVIAMQSVLLTFTNIGREVFPDAAKAVLDLSEKMGQDLKSSAVQLGKALNDPVQGIGALQRVGVSFSEGQKEVIKQLASTGNLAEAQALILRELQTEFGGAAEAARDTLGGALKSLGNAFGDLFELKDDAGGLRQEIEKLVALLTDNGVVSAVQAIGREIVRAFSDAAETVRQLQLAYQRFTQGNISAGLRGLFTGSEAQGLPQDTFNQFGGIGINQYLFNPPAGQFPGPQFGDSISDVSGKMREYAKIAKDAAGSIEEVTKASKKSGSATSKYKDDIEKTSREMMTLQSATATFIDDFVQGFIDGQNIVDNLGDAIGRLGSTLRSSGIDQLVDSLFKSAKGGIADLAGSLGLGNLGSVLGLGAGVVSGGATAPVGAVSSLSKLLAQSKNDSKSPNKEAKKDDSVHLAAAA